MTAVMQMATKVTFLIRRDTSGNWSSVNPTLRLAEPAIETDTRRIKYGDGSTEWDNLPYASVPIPAGGSSQQVLKKFSNNDFEFTWASLTAGTTAFTPAGNLEATDVQAALVELDSEKASSQAAFPSGGDEGQILLKVDGADYNVGWLDLTAGIVDFTPTGNLEATDVQGALAELDSEKVSSADVVLRDAGDNTSQSMNVDLTEGDQHLDGFLLDMDVTGTESFTSNRTHVGQEINVRSTATGMDQTSGSRQTIYGLQQITDAEGPTYNVTGQYGITYAANNEAGGRNTQAYGTRQICYAQNNEGLVGNIYAGHFTAIVDCRTNGTISNAYGSWSRAVTAGTNISPVGILRGSYSEVETGTNSPSVTSAQAVNAIVDHNSGTITNSYLFHGDYQVTAGAIIGTRYGIFIDDDCINYFQGQLRIGSNSGSEELSVTGDGRVTGYLTVADEAYSGSWDTSLEVPTKNAIYDEMETKLTGTAIDSTDALIPTLNSPWINYGAGFGGARYFKDAAGIVHIEGLIQAPGGSSTSGVTLFTLLSGYRPADTLMFTTANGGGAGRIDVDSSGNVIMQSGNTAFTSLSGISFIPA